MNKALIEEEETRTAVEEEWGPVIEHELEFVPRKQKTKQKGGSPVKDVKVFDVAGQRGKNATRTAGSQGQQNTKKVMPLSSLLSRVLKLDLKSFRFPSFLDHPSFNVKMSDDDLPEGIVIDSFVAEVEYKKVSVMKLQA